MSGKLPEPNEVTLLLCEDVRIETNNKITLLGAYLGNSIRARDIGETSVLPLSFVLCVGGGVGVYDMTLSLHYPSGKEILRDSRPMTKLEGQMAAHLFKLANLRLLEEGTYKIDFKLDGRSYPLFFHIAHDPTIKN